MSKFKDIENKAKQELKEAYDFDKKDPLFSLSRDEMRGPALTRRTTLRLMAAAGGLTLAHVLPGLGPKSAFAAGNHGGHLRCAWAGVAEIITLDPARINQVLQFQIVTF